MNQIGYYGSLGHVEAMCYRLSWYLEAYERRENSVIEGIFSNGIQGDTKFLYLGYI